MQSGAGDLFGGTSQMMPAGGFTGNGGGVSPGGSNQWMSYPALPNFNPSSNPSAGAWTTPTSTAGSFHLDNPLIGGKHELGGGMATSPTMDPTFTNSFYQMLQGLMSGGGGDLQNQLLSFLGGGKSNIPGASSLSEMANTGDPISALPEWQKMIEAQQHGIGENAANLKEQFAFMGDLASSPMATGMSDYFSQTSKDQNALLGQLDTQAMESAMQRKLTASQDITGMAGAESQFLQQLFQGGALASPNLYNDKKGSSMLGGIGSLLGGAAQGIGGFAAGFGGTAAGATTMESIMAGLAAI
jgi:hypothetical protein